MWLSLMRSLGDSFFGNVANYFSPLYFTVKEVNEVMPTEEPCDLAYVFGDGLLDPVNIPEGFPNPGKYFYSSTPSLPV